jgi:hypothetical protein
MKQNLRKQAMKEIRIVKIVVLLLLLVQFGNLKSHEFILESMRDEIERSIDNLYLESLEKPYYISYKLEQKDYYFVHAVLGKIVESDNNKASELTVDLRVGDYKFDNSNFLDFGFSFFGSGDDEEPFRNRRIPLELDYNSLRRELWLATDAAYKQVSEIYTKKSAIVKNRMRKDTTHDFLRIPAKKLYDSTKIPVYNREEIENICSELSSIFRNYPDISQSSVGVEYLPERVFFVNSEGREYIQTKYYAGLEVVAITQAEDGMPLTNHYTCFCKYPSDFPSIDSLKRAVKNLADKLIEIREAETLEESYSGPVLFEDQAAAAIFAQVFAPNLVTQRMPLTERGVQESDRYTAFQTKIGGRVLPEFLSVEALPGKSKINDTELLGSYKIDEDGVIAQDVTLVKDGFLKNLLSSRIPTRRVRQTNGHKRGGAPMISVLRLTSDKAHQLVSDSLKQKMMKLCRDRELEFGIIVRKILDQNIQYTTMSRISAGIFPMGSGNKENTLLDVVKIYPDGREELLRGVEAKGISVQSFKDILNVGMNEYVMNYLAPSVTSPYLTGGSQYVGASIIAPELLFEDCEIKPVEEDFPKVPVLENPLTNMK